MANEATQLDPDPWFAAYQCYQQGMADAPADTPAAAAQDFADELKLRCPYWPPPAESMLRIQVAWLSEHPGLPLPPNLFGAEHGLWVPGA
jgi:hypothetical protein